ncbi:MAG: IS1595 family transposase [Bacteroidetes bacterium]|nr:IS1595 family transposase [Bacteroidota bacterium]
MTHFKSLADVANYFNHEDKARTFLEKLRWPDGRIICPICGVRGAYRMGDCKTYKCRDKDCKARFSVTKGTYFENTKLPLAKWFMAIYLVSAHRKGISSCQLARDLNIGQKAAWFVLHRVREMLKDGSGTFLTGLVEIDETYVGGKVANMRKTKRKQITDAGIDNKTPVMGMVQRDGKAKLQVIGKNSFKTVIHQNVKKEAILITDSHTGYQGLVNEYAGHEAVNHSQLEFKRGIYYTNSVEGFFSTFKRGIIGIYHQISPKHLQRYCEEFSYRFNFRKIKDGERFINCFENIQGRLTYKQLIGEGREPKTKGIEFINGE